MVINRFKKLAIAQDDDSLSKKVAKGSIWVFFIKIGKQLLSLARNIVLARILAPHDFGLFGIALLTLSTLEHFTSTGFKQALVQKKEEPEKYLDTAWTVEVVRSTVLFLLLFILSGPIAGFFDSPSAKALIQVLSFSILLKGFINIGVIYFQKELKFHKTFIFDLAPPLMDLVITISTLLILRNVWALVIGSLAGSLTNVIVSYLIHHHRPKLRFKLSEAKELFDFSKWIMGSTLLNFLLTEGDDILVGRILGPASLGLYQMAYRISNFPATQITQLINQVSFPAYAIIQDQIKRLRSSYLKVLKSIAFFSFPISFYLFFFANDFTSVVLGEKWLAAVPAIQGLVVWGLVRSIGGTTGPLFQAIGRPDLATKVQLIKLIILAAIIYPLTTSYGLIGTVIAVVISALISNPIADYLVIKKLSIKLTDFISRLFFPTLATVITWLALRYFYSFWSNPAQLLPLIINLLLAITFYLAAVLLFDRLGWYKISFKNFLKRSFK
jgi:O-antigen/teichoic acid export membrane protein